MEPHMFRNSPCWLASSPSRRFSMMLTSCCPVVKNDMNDSAMQHATAKSTMPVKNHRRSFWNICVTRSSPMACTIEGRGSAAFTVFFFFCLLIGVFCLP